MLGFLLIIIIGIYFYNTNKKITELEKENFKLKKQIRDMTEDEKQVQKIETVISENTQPVISQATELSEEEKLERKLKREREERERKNTNILITGAFLIVLAAIVFLMSTWNAIPNIVKAAVLTLLVGVFLGASKIAKEKFKLEKTSNTFFYIAMAYVPICLISFSVFGLFGWYFSIFGDGRYTYLAVAMTLNSIIYYYTYKSRKVNGLFYGSILSQILSVILFGLIFAENFLFISSILLAYNICLILLTKKDTSLDLLKYIFNGIPYMVSLVAFFGFAEKSIYMLAILIGLAINFFLLYLKKNNNIANAYLANISLYSIGLYFTAIYAADMNSNLKIIITMLYIIFALLIEGYIISSSQDNKLGKASMIISLISMTILYFWTVDMQSGITERIVIKPYMISFVETILMLISFIKSKELGKTVLGYLIPISLFATLYNILDIIDASYHLYVILSLAVFVVGELIVWDDFKHLNTGFMVVSNVILSIVYLFCGIFVNEFKNDVIYLILLEAVYAYCYLKNTKLFVFKYLAYINCNFILLTCANFLNVPNDIKLLIPAIVSSVIVYVESKYNNLKDEFSDVFNIIIQIIAYINLLSWGNIQSVFLSILYSGYLIYDNLKYDKIQYFRIIPLIGLLATTLESNIDKELMTSILLISTIALSLMTFYKKKVTLDTIFSGIYLFYTVAVFDNEYIREVLFLAWSISHLYFIEDQKAKDVFKGLAYFGTLLIYRTFYYDLNLTAFNSLEVIGVMIFAIAMLKNIIIKYVKESDTIEYIVYILINLFAIVNYVDEKDGMVYVLFLVGLLIFSYTKKYGALFIVSMFTILGNAILLTREFWFNVPWWIYLLLIGSILIAFAIKNESDEKKEKIGVGNIIKNIKDKIER